MNMQELIDKLQELVEEGEAEGETSTLSDINVSGYLLRRGIMMKLDDVFIDGTTLHLDFRERILG